MNTTGFSWNDLLSQYRMSLEAGNRSPRTIEWYLEILRRFFGFLEKKSPTKSIREIGREEVRQYIRYLQGAPRWPHRPKNGKDLGKLSPSSIQGHVRAIKAFLGWLVEEGYIDSNPLVKFPLPTVPQYVIRTLTLEHIELLLSAIDRTTSLGFMYYCIILVLLDAGMRISELVNIKMTDLDIQQGLVTILGKGQKQRVVPLTRFTLRELLRYIQNFRKNHGFLESPYLFPDSNGGHISTNGIQQYLRRLAEKAGLKDVKVTPHVFRHTFGTNAAARSVNAFMIKDMMGHSSLQTTNKYIHLQTADIKAQHNRFSLVNDLFQKK